MLVDKEPQEAHAPADEALDGLSKLSLSLSFYLQLAHQQACLPLWRPSSLAGPIVFLLQRGCRSGHPSGRTSRCTSLQGGGVLAVVEVATDPSSPAASSSEGSAS
jgi:hypothetical protein